jgi:two-component system LytT family response regulator
MTKWNEISCLIVDDQEISRIIIRKLISLDKSLKLVGECADAIQAHEMILTHKIDLIFLDVQIPGISGIDFAQVLNGKGPLIIFITSSSEAAVQAFDLNAVDFLLKPVLSSRFLEAVNRARELITVEDPIEDYIDGQFVFIRESNLIRKLKLKDILYFESLNNYVKIQLQDSCYSIYSSMKSIEEKLSSMFFRVHRSFIINLSKIDTIDSGMLVISGKLIPISDSYRAVLNKKIRIL